jgi:Uma2 family endonuclease
MVASEQDAGMTLTEWHELERTSEVKHEYIDGYVYAMAGGSAAHSLVAVNVASALNAAFGEGPCIAYNSDMATQVSESRFTYADVVVSCSARDQATRELTEVVEPRVVFEVLSDSTEAKDRGRKSDDYRRCPSLQEYVLIGTQYQRVEVYRRTEDGWGIFRFYGAEDDLVLTSISVRIPVAALYRRTDVPEMTPE